MRRLLAPAVAAVLVTAGLGCGGTPQLDGGGRVAGGTLAVVALLPLTGPQAAAASDVVDGARLALARARSRVGRFAVRLAVVDEGTADPAQVATAAAAAARVALADPQAIAAIGSLDSEAARASVPLLNAAGILQVSPSAGYPGLTAPGAVPGEPDRYYPSGVRSFARVGRDDAAMADAMARVAVRGRPVAVESAPGVVPETLAAALRGAVRRRGLALTDDPRRARTVLYAGADPDVPAGIAGTPPHPRVVVGEDAVRAGVRDRLAGAVARRVTLVHRTTRLGDGRFRADFRDRFARRPGPFAAPGYAAMRRILAALAGAGANANDRTAVVRALRRVRVPRSGFVAVPTARR